MILALAVLAGIIAGLGRSWFGKRAYHIPTLRFIWLVVVAFVIQYLAFMFQPTRQIFPRPLAAAALFFSQLLLLAFSWINRRQPGFWLLGVGLGLNFIVILLNGGFMPISPETAAALAPGWSPADYQVGMRLQGCKDWIVPTEQMRIGWLADRFLLPSWSPFRAAFSFGDILIALGALWLLWVHGGAHKPGDGKDSHYRVDHLSYSVLDRRTS